MTRHPGEGADGADEKKGTTVKDELLAALDNYGRIIAELALIENELTIGVGYYTDSRDFIVTVREGFGVAAHYAAGGETPSEAYVGAVAKRAAASERAAVEAEVRAEVEARMRKEAA